MTFLRTYGMYLAIAVVAFAIATKSFELGANASMRLARSLGMVGLTVLAATLAAAAFTAYRRKTSGSAVGRPGDGADSGE